MPAQFAPRGVALAEINNEMNRGLLQALEMRQQQEMQNQRIRADQTLQTQQVMARQREQAAEMSFRAAQAQQERDFTLERDRLLNKQDLDRIAKEQDAKIAERTFTETGLTPDGIKQWATNNSALTGQPMSYDQAYQTLAGYRRESASRQEMALKLEYLDRADANKLSRSEREAQKKINALNDWETKQIEDPGLNDAAKRAARDYAERGRTEILTGVKLPPKPETVEQWTKANTIPNSNGAIRIQKSDGTFDVRQLRNVGKGGGAEAITVEDDEVDSYLEKEFKRRFAATAPLDPATPKDGVVGVWENNKYRPYLPEEVNSEERWMARLKIMAQKKQDLETMRLLDQYHADGMPYETALNKIVADRQKAAQGFRIQEAEAQARETGAANSTAKARGEGAKWSPDSAAPAGGGDEIEELRQVANDTSLPEDIRSDARKALAALGG